MANNDLMLQYTAHNETLKAQGVKLVQFSCPTCAKSIDTRPAPKGERWDSLAICPHCEAMYMKITDGKKAFGVIPDGQSKTAS